MTKKKRIGILISGRGSNMAALIEACNAPDFPAEISLVVSNRPKAIGLQTAKDAGIQSLAIDHKAFKTREAFDEVLDETFTEAGVDLICSAGFLRILTADFVEKWKDKQLNIHPSLLPSFKGLNIHQRVLDAGVTVTGCTVHFMRTEMDSGPIIAQAAVPVYPKDTPESLGERVLKAEHKLYPHALRMVAAEEVRVVNDRVVRSFNHETASNETRQLFSPNLRDYKEFQT
ncbi:MAG: phosphoribosylglycinamide formyltransferase [Methyloligellaceae bacterium]